MTQKEALTILKTGANVFLTGEPGSGKTHTVNQYIKYLREHGVEPAITAATGLAATHLGGVTIHSWSGLGIKAVIDRYELDRLATNEKLVKRITAARVLIIDEISMLSAHTLDMVEVICREIRGGHEPFGGLQVILVGDFFQLPPISRRGVPVKFAYESETWKHLKLVVCYLAEQHRQDDLEFLEVLSGIRRREVNSKIREHLKSRSVKERPEGATKLYSHNEDVETINLEELKKLPGKEHVFKMTAAGKKAAVEALKNSCLSPEELALKVGAVVMFTKNDSKLGVVNGTLGVVEEFAGFNNFPVVRLKNGELVEVERDEWVVEDGGKIVARVEQLPLRLAWAITIHKSQGLSLEAAVMDLSRVFEFGQGYVALSRVRRLSGLYLLGLNEQALRVHPEIATRDERFRAASAEAARAFNGLETDELKTMQTNFLKVAKR